MSDAAPQDDPPEEVFKEASSQSRKRGSKGNRKAQKQRYQAKHPASIASYQRRYMAARRLAVKMQQREDC